MRVGSGLHQLGKSTERISHPGHDDGPSLDASVPVNSFLKRREFQEKALQFTEINVTERPEAIPGLLRLTHGERLVPVIVQGQRVSVAPEGG
jgi:hypothetical protein